MTNAGVVALESLRMHAAAAAAVAERARQEAERARDERVAAARRSHRVFAEVTRGMMGGHLLASRGAVIAADVCRACHDAGATAAEHARLCGGYYQGPTR